MKQLILGNFYTMIKTRPSSLPKFEKRQFDPTNKQDLREYKFFLENGRWLSGVCPFEVEWPYLGIPQMINDKITEHYLFKILKLD